MEANRKDAKAVYFVSLKIKLPNFKHYIFMAFISQQIHL